MIPTWLAYLRKHPDHRFAEYIYQGISNGFRIGFNYASPLHPARGNMSSTRDNATVVDEYIEEELQIGRLVSVTPSSIPGIQLSPFGVIPKRGQPNKWRLIIDLSSPKGYSVNDGIDPALTSVQYSSIDDAVSYINQLGTGTLMAKLDIKSAYRNIPVHPHDRPLLGTRWRDVIYLNTRLPFGLRSLFTAIANTVLWIIWLNGVPWIIDDFLLFAPPTSSDCHHFLQVACSTCTELGFIAHKIVGPTHCVTFLGIEIDSIAAQLRLPADKLSQLTTDINCWRNRRSCTKRQLLSLIGSLSHASVLVGLSSDNLSSTVSELHHHIRLNHAARADIAWWITFIEHWNGCSLFTTPAPSILFSTDASGYWGFGAINWFKAQWPANWLPINIATKVLAGIIWGQVWSTKHVRCSSDNLAVVHAINVRSVRDHNLMRLLRCLFFIEAHFNFRITAAHISGSANTAADMLSRNNITDFLSVFPQVSPFPTPIPLPALELLLDLSADWPSRHWSSRLRDIMLNL